MKAFSAEVQMDYDTYYIDYKPDMPPNNRFAVWSFQRTAVYVASLEAAMNQIEFDNDQDIEQANYFNELEHNK